MGFQLRDLALKHASELDQVRVENERAIVQLRASCQNQLEELQATHSDQLQRKEEDLLAEKQRVENLHFQNNLREAYFKKREESLMRDYESKVGLLLAAW